MDNLKIFLKNRLKTYKYELIEKKAQLAEEHHRHLWDEICLLDKPILEYLELKMKMRK